MMLVVRRKVMHKVVDKHSAHARPLTENLLKCSSSWCPLQCHAGVLNAHQVVDKEGGGVAR